MNKPVSSEISLVRNLVKKGPTLRPIELWLNVYLSGPPEELSLFPEWLIQARCKKASDIDDADIVIFAGGPDVNPALYGAEKDRTTHFDSKLDEEQMNLYEYCYFDGIPMLGICRGAQFLHVMNEGVLYQDVNNHFGDHGIIDANTGELITPVSSVHHQMIKSPNNNPDFQIVAYAENISDYRRLDPSTVEKGGSKDVEAFFYRSSCCLGFQGHPEYRGYSHYSKYVCSKIDEYFLENPDLTYIKSKGRGNRLRIKQSILENREV
jgi:putative glutamine amidotransferase